MAMATAYPSTVTQSGGFGLTDWTTPANAQGIPDAVTTNCESFGAAKTLSFTGFGFSIPVGATIDGIVVTPHGNSLAETASYTLNFYEGGGSSLGGGSAVDTDVFGTSTNGRGLTVANINNLRITIAWGSQGDFSTINLDALQVDVYYSIASTTSGGYRSRRRGFGRLR